MKAPSWDLSDLFSSIGDHNIPASLKRSAEEVQSFGENYRGKLSSPDLDSETLLQALTEYEAIVSALIKPEIFSYLVFSSDSKKHEHGAFFQKMQAMTQEISRELIFFELELGKIPEQKMKSFMNDPLLKNYSHYLKRQQEIRAHYLTEAEEKIDADKSLTGNAAWSRLFDELLAQKKFTLKVGGKKKSLGEEEVLHELYNPSQSRRAAAAKSFTQGLGELAKQATYITNTLAEDRRIEDRLRKFSTPEAFRHLSNETTQETIDTMVDSVLAGSPVVADFYRFKKKKLKLKTLYDYDRYAPMAKSTKKFSFDEAKRLVLESFREFSPTYAKTAELFFEKDWIDAAVRDGKRGGAFCMPVSPDMHPYVSVNFKGGLKDVLTLAHELGHAVHFMLARGQSQLNFSMPLTVAETASIFGEMLVFNKLKNELKGADRFALYIQKIEGIFASVNRQISMYRFEQDVHAARRKKGELSIGELNAFWRSRQKEMFGNSVTLTKDYDLWWSYIPHFIHTPFYVYAYAFGELLTLSLYSQYLKEGSAFADKYLVLLSSGGSKSPHDLVKPLGIDLDSREFWDGGMRIIKDMIRESKELG